MYLGIDPGVRKLGYALIDDNLGIIDAGIILQEKKSVTRSDQFDRMNELFTFFGDFLVQHAPMIKHVGIEQLFFTKFNQKNAEFVYGIRGALIVLLQQHGISFSEYTPIELKKRITGNGKAQKILMQNMIMKLFGLQSLPQYDDAADALGLAYLASRHNTK